jgi:(4S)-4-hydroxy-5-phosphonooxypentane-2,3-dione isomerase
MTGFVVIVEFRLKAGARSDFRRLIDANASASVARERGCRRFDVVEPRDAADRVLLYEIYDDEAAFDAHCRSEHYAHFNSASAPLVNAKTVMRCDLVHEGLAAAEI